MRRELKVYGFNLSSCTVDCGVFLQATLPRPRLEAKAFSDQWIECMHHCNTEDYTQVASVHVQNDNNVCVKKNFLGTLNSLTAAAT